MKIEKLILLLILAPTGLGPAAFANLGERRNQADHAARTLQNMTVSNAILFESGKDGDQVALCRVAVAGRQDLVPSFLAPASQNSGSSPNSANSEPELVGLPVCSPEQTGMIATIAAESSQPIYAGAPLVVLAGICAVSFILTGASFYSGGSTRDPHDSRSSSPFSGPLISWSSVVGSFLGGRYSAEKFLPVTFARFSENFVTGGLLGVGCSLAGVAVVVGYTLQN